MKIRYFSDIHLEFFKNNTYPIIKKGLEDILILSGDIGNPYNKNYQLFFDDISLKFKKIFVISGNHEYYNNEIILTDIYLNDFFKKYDNISFLNNSCELYEGYNFVGTTLWSKIYLKDYIVNDLYKIKNFDIDKYNILHEKSKQFIKDTLKIKDNIIMITHHGPSFYLVDKQYKDSLYNQCFYSNQDDLIKENYKNIKAWFYGHTHTPSIKKLYNIDFLCNPIGYPDENDVIDYDKIYNL